MNGNQMLLLAWWELAGFVGLLLLGFVFVPIYYRKNCTTITQLLEQNYESGEFLRTAISALFLIGNLFIYLPAVIYGGAIFLDSLFEIELIFFGVNIEIGVMTTLIAMLGASYAIFGGLRAVAILDTYGGIVILGLAMVVVLLSLQAVDFDIVSDVPDFRLTLMGDNDSPMPFHTLFTGMIFIQIFYWSTNQNITQKALATSSIREAQMGVFVAAIVRVIIVPPIVVIPGIVAYKLFGDVGDRAYGMIVKEVLPSWTGGLFAAMIVAAVITTHSAIMNATITLYTVDFHQKFISNPPSVRNLNRLIGTLVMLISVALVPLFAYAESIINLIQELNELLSMPILSAFITALLFRNVDSRAAACGLIYGFVAYGFHNFFLYKKSWPNETNFYQSIGLPAIHYIDVMVFVLFTSIIVSLTVNRFVFKNNATLFFLQRERP